MWIKFIKVVITCHKKYFHIIIEPAFNLNKTKIYFSACLQNSRHFEFQISSTQGKFIDFSQKRFFDRESFHNGFFSEWGASASALARARQGPHPHSLKKSVMKRFSIKKKFLWKVNEFTLSRADLKFKMSRILQTSRKINFGFVQIESRFNYNMNMI